MTLQSPEYIRSLVPYVPGKPIEETQRELGIRRVIKLASNENPLGPSPRAIDAIRRSLKSIHLYPDASAFRLKSALSHHLGFDPQRIVIGNGSNEVIDFLIRAFCVVGDAIVTSQAAFIAYRICAQIHGVTTLEARLDSDLQADPDQMLALVRDHARVKMVFIANPNNPTGSYWTRDQLRRFLIELKRIRSGEVLAVLDYAYWEYVTASDLSDPEELLNEFADQVVVLRTFSKVYGLAGMRVGYGVGPAKIMQPLEKIRQPFNLNSPALVAGEAALLDRAFVKKSQSLNRSGMKFWKKAFKDLKVPFWESQGNFLLINAQAGFGCSGVELFQRCLKRGVILRPIANYGLPGAIRLSIGTEKENHFALKALTAEKVTRE